MELIIPIKTQYKIFESNNRRYMRTRDLAHILEVKQPFEFTSNIKKEFMDESVILKGSITKSFRDVEDSDRTTFIDIDDALLMLEYGEFKHKINKDRKHFMITYLKNLV